MSSIGPEKAMVLAEPTGFRCSGCRAIFSFMEEGEPPLALGVRRATEPGARVREYLEAGLFCEACEETFVNEHDYVEIGHSNAEEEGDEPDEEPLPER